VATYSATWSSFNDGELSPLMDGRFDLPQYMKSGRTMLNFIPTVQGPMVKRGGTRLIGQIGGTLPSLLIPFSRSRTESYLIEFYDLTARFYFNGALVEFGGVPFTIPTPYAGADLYNSDGTPALTFAESVDQLYLAHPKYAPQILSFFSASNWTLLPLAFVDGPWQDGNGVQTTRMSIAGGAAVGAHIAITSTADVFSAGMVGSLIRIHQQDFSQLKEWYPGQRTTGGGIVVGNQERSGTNTYEVKSVAPGTVPGGGVLDWVETGSSTLITTDGDQWDGPQDVVPNPATANHYYGRGVQWTYKDCGYGVAVITAFSDAQHVAATVLRSFPAALTTVPSYRWELGAWSTAAGWPRLVTFWKQRLVFAGTDRVWMSVSGDFANFADLQFGQVLTDSALTAQVLSDQLNSINWLAPQKTLLVGTTGGEFVISPQSISDPFGPTNFQIDPYSNYGGRQIAPIRVQTSTIFVQQNGRALREFSYVFTSDAYQSTDLTPLAEHITEGGIVDMAWAKFPYYVVWCVLGNGNIAAFTFNPEQAVKCWHEHNLAGDAFVHCAATVPSADGSVDDLYMVVNRPLADVNFYNVEKMALPFDANAPGARQQDMFYVDCGLTVDNTISATLTPGSGATVQQTTGVAFTAGSGVFSVTDVGRYIDYDWDTTGVNGKGLTVPVPTRGRAQITAVNSATDVLATIIAPWPNLDTIASGDWRMSITVIDFPPGVWETGTVSMLLDGAAAPDQTYNGGPITLPYPASVVQIGLKSPSVWQSFRPEGGDPTGSAMGKPRRVIQASVRVNDTLGVEIGRDLNQMQVIETRPAGEPDDNPPPLFSGNLPDDPTTRITFDGDWDTDGSVIIRCQQPLAATICAVSVTIDEQPDN